MIIKGRVRWNTRGFAFILGEDDNPDVFVPPGALGGAMDGDLVEVKAKPDTKGYRGRVTKVLERGGNTVSGRYKRMKKHGVLEPIAPLPYKIIIPHSQSAKAQSGDIIKVSVDVPKKAGRQRVLTGNVEQILKYPPQAPDDLKNVVLKFGLPWLFRKPIQQEAKQAARISMKAQLKQRRDLRQRVLFTIDSRSARDFDDAIGIEKLDDGNRRLTVAIADVAELVQVDSQLDQEAYSRGFSCYFPETAIPMLPEVLSNGVLSLNPDEDRLAMVCEMILSPRAKLISCECYEAVIRSHARLCYEDVGPFLKKKGRCPVKSRRIGADLKELHRLSQHLYKQRLRQGSLDLDMPEIRVVLDDDGHVDKLTRRDRNPAEHLVEEAMLLANLCTCKFMQDHKLPVLYRIHERPNEEDLLALTDTLRQIGFDAKLIADLEKAIKRNKGLFKAMQAIVDRAKELPLNDFITQQVLRSLKQACYAPEDAGHFGLAFTGYLHFTSPIRRYSDLIVHRILKEFLRGGPLNSKSRKRWNRYLKDVAPEISKRERITNEAMMEVQSHKVAEYMHRHLGDTFKGTVTSVLNFGLFVRIPDPPVDGLIPMDELNPSKITEGKSVKIKKRTLKLGDQVDVLVARVDLERGQIDLSLT